MLTPKVDITAEKTERQGRKIELVCSLHLHKVLTRLAKRPHNLQAKDVSNLRFG
jgi:hypothetical protein